MPAPSAGFNNRHCTLKRVIAAVAIIAFLAINAYGLCSTYGKIEIA